MTTPASRRKSILVVAPYLVLPANNGGRIHLRSMVEPICEEYDLHYLGLATPAEIDELSRGGKPLLEQYARLFKTFNYAPRPPIPAQMGRRREVLRHLAEHALRRLPLMDVSYYSAELLRLARRVVDEHHIDLLEIHHLHMAFVRQHFPHLPALLMNHNIESDISPFWPRYSDDRVMRPIWNFAGRLSRRNARKIEIENRLKFDLKSFISPIDAGKVNSNACATNVLMTGVDLRSAPKRFNQDKFVMLWVGGFSWPFFSEGCLFFINEVWPKLKARAEVPLEVHFVGGEPPPELVRHADGRSVFVHGFVSPADTFFEAADALIVPIRAASGICVKIIEALNVGLPVVSSPAGAQGLGVRHPEDILIAEKADEFCEHLLGLASSIPRRQALSARGRAYVQDRHSPDYVRERKRAMYESILERTSR